MDQAEKRKYERVTLPPEAAAYVEDTNGKKIGALRVIGQGGLLCECDPKLYRPGQMVTLRIVDPTEGIERALNCEVRYSEEKGIGFAFDDLGPDSAVEIGVIIGKYYAGHR
ncbi:MAG TPA: PilZ domain-containing protein [Terriglobales bacterium]|nr:PilZ domain-containing protein [Terriglobales bacterium]